MIRLFSFIMVLIFAISCGSLMSDFIKRSGNPPIIKSTENEFLPYINDFEVYWGKNVKTPIYFNDLPDNVAGVCYEWNSGETAIEISRKWWNIVSEARKKVLIFHELGHCELKRGHLASLFPDDICPTSIMYRSVLSDYCSNTYMNEYLIELFQ